MTDWDRPDPNNPTLSLAYAVGNALPILSEMASALRGIYASLGDIEERLAQIDDTLDKSPT